MKQIFIMVCFSLLCCFASCAKTLESTGNGEEQNSRLIEVDSLLQHHPDSALVYLVSVVDSVGCSPDKEYASLMLSEACFKIRREVAYCDEVEKALTYFDSVSSVYPNDKDMAFLSARSHYMNAICINDRHHLYRRFPHDVGLPRVL